MGDAVSMDRMTGVLLGAACGDALGAGYEFGPPVSADERVVMRGQGAFAPGEWTDDAAQMIAVAGAATEGPALDSEAGLEAVARGLMDWYLSPASSKDIGIHSAAVFARVSGMQANLFAKFRKAALEKEIRNPGTSGGNGALMRTAPVAMALWREPERMVAAAMTIGGMTHADPLSEQSCAVWCLAIRAALLADDPSDIAGLAAQVEADLERYLPEHAAYWREVLAGAFGTSPVDYYAYRPGNGYCVTTVRAAWAAVTSVAGTGRRPGDDLRLAIEAAVRGGGDTDTVACVAGALAGALWGASAVPLQWRRRIFGWPGMRDRGLVRMAHAIGAHGFNASRWPDAGHVDYSGWGHRDSLAVHPHDDGVVLSGFVAALGRVEIPGGAVDAVVSLCRVGTDDLAALGVPDEDRVEVWLVDGGRDDNPNLQLTVDEAADAVAAFRAEGKRVLLHCVAAQSRTPTVAARYSVRHLGMHPAQARLEVCAALPAASLHPGLLATVGGWR
ncbi:MAG: ADP-ribosylglycohydrolase family protein [Actinomycetota bacterium]|nr:ADP-ribosylglycohydrolase family protein [Actinomycetota bacterium]